MSHWIPSYRPRIRLPDRLAFIHLAGTSSPLHPRAPPWARRGGEACTRERGCRRQRKWSHLLPLRLLARRRRRPQASPSPPLHLPLVTSPLEQPTAALLPPPRDAVTALLLHLFAASTADTPPPGSAFSFVFLPRLPTEGREVSSFSRGYSRRRQPSLPFHAATAAADSRSRPLPRLLPLSLVDIVTFQVAVAWYHLGNSVHRAERLPDDSSVVTLARLPFSPSLALHIIDLHLRRVPASLPLPLPLPLRLPPPLPMDVDTVLEKSVLRLVSGGGWRAVLVFVALAASAAVLLASFPTSTSAPAWFSIYSSSSISSASARPPVTTPAAVEPSGGVKVAPLWAYGPASSDFSSVSIVHKPPSTSSPAPAPIENPPVPAPVPASMEISPAPAPSLPSLWSEVEDSNI
ncbi:protein enabled homolog [Zingiber officinale]|uniref:protein enabled homolog n=1 Tax=Zingiber officinale TaxID=94328 RepID=UPI001C4BA2A1|nr:protein enabled homolog [Zingiber officinale]